MECSESTRLWETDTGELSVEKILLLRANSRQSNQNSVSSSASSYDFLDRDSAENVKCNKFIYCTFLLLGTGSLLPFNMFITATGYFKQKLMTIPAADDTGNGTTVVPGVDVEAENNLQKKFESYFTTFSCLVLLFMSLGNTLLVRYVGTSVRLIGSIISTLLILIPTIVLIGVDTSHWQKTFLAITVGNICVLKLGTAILQGATLGVAGLLGQNYTQSAFIGISLSGLLPSLMQILCLAVFEDVNASAYLYFFCGEAFYLVILIVSLFFLQHPVYRSGQGRLELTESLGLYKAASSATKLEDCLYIFRQTSPLGLCVFHTFLVTFILFPNFMTHIEDYESESRFWYPIAVFFCFNCFDLFGRLSASYFRAPRNTKKVTLACLLRNSFLIIYLFTNYQPRSNGLPVLIENPCVVLLLHVTLAFSNGYLGSICFMYGAKNVQKRADLLEQAGVVLLFYMCLGMVSGSVLSFVYINLP